MRSPIQHSFTLLILLGLQILLFNQLTLFNVATPFAFLVGIFMLPFSIPIPFYYLICFFVGFLVDWLSTPMVMGLHMFSALFASSFRRPLMLLTASGSAAKGLEEFSFYKQDFFWYVIFLAPLIFIHHFCYFFLEAYSLTQLGWTLLKIFSSTIFTFVFAYLICIVFYKR